jgi:hypothetical protein
MKNMFLRQSQRSQWWNKNKNKCLRWRRWMFLSR